MFPIWMKYLLKYFNCFGFHSLPVARVGGKSGSTVIFTLHIVLCIWCSISTFTSFLEEQTFMEFIDSLNFLLYYITSASCYWFIIYDSYTKQTFQQGFWDIFQRINEHFHSQADLKIWGSLMVFILIIIGDLTVLTISLVYTNSIGTPSCVLMHCIFLSVFDHRIFFFLLHLNVIAFQLDKIDSKLKHMNKLAVQSQFVLFEINKHELHRLKWIQDYYKLVYEMTENMNAIFGVSHLGLFLLSFHSSVTFLNFIYRQFLNKFTNYNAGNRKFIISSVTEFCLIIIFYKNQF